MQGWNLKMFYYLKKTVRYFFKQRGQGMTEVLIVVALIAIAGIMVSILYGDNIRKQIGKTGNAVGGKDTALIDDTEKADKEDEHKNLNDFADMEEEVSAPPPPPLPAETDLLGHDVRHHIGDGLYGGSAGGGNLQNEGTSFNVRFELTQDMIDYANDLNGGFLYLNFDAWGCNYNVNSVDLGGYDVGNINNGSNSFSVNASDLGVGSHDLTFFSYEYSGGYFDDFEVADITIDYFSNE